MKIALKHTAQAVTALALMGSLQAHSARASSRMCGSTLYPAVAAAACVSNSSSTYNRYWTMNLGRQ